MEFDPAGAALEVNAGVTDLIDAHLSDGLGMDQKQDQDDPKTS
jgi:hypothetical protein